MVRHITWFLFLAFHYSVVFAQTPYSIFNVNASIDGVFCKDSPLVFNINGEFSNGCGAVEHAVHHIEDNGPDKLLTIVLDFHVPSTDTGCTQAILPFNYEYSISGLPEGLYSLVVWDEQNKSILLDNESYFEIEECHEDEQFLFINEANVKDLFVCQDSNYQLNLIGYFPSDCPEIIGNSVFYNVDTIDVFFEFYPGDPPCSNESVFFNFDIELQADNSAGKLIRVFQEHLDTVLIDLDVNYIDCVIDTTCLIEEILCYDWVQEELELINAYCDTCLLDIVSGFMFYHEDISGMQIIEMRKRCETTERTFFTCDGEYLNTCTINGGDNANSCGLWNESLSNTALLWDCYKPICVTSTETESKKHFSIYPNPINDFLYIEAPDQVYFTTTILDVHNHIVMESLNESRIDISSLPQGMYYILVEDKRSYAIESVIKL